MKVSEQAVVAFVVAILLAGVVWKLDSQVTDIKFRAFRIGCMDSGKLDYNACTKLAHDFIDGKIK